MMDAVDGKNTQFFSQKQVVMHILAALTQLLA
jgi:hypothetical protein